MIKNTLILVLALCSPIILSAQSAKNKTAKSGNAPYINRSYFNPSVSAGDDFYMHCNGTWFKNNPIPGDKVRWGSFDILRQQTNDQLHQLMLDAGKKGADRSAQMVSDYFKSGMDSARLEKLGYQPIKPLLNQIDTLNNNAEIVGFIHEQRAKGNGMLYGFGISPDRENSDVYLCGYSQGGTTMPDRDYYLKNDKRSLKYKEAFQKYMIDLFMLCGDSRERAWGRANSVMRIETALAQSQYAREEMRDPYKTFHKTSLKQFVQTAPSFQFEKEIKLCGLTGIDTVNVGNPEFFKAVEALMIALPVEDWKNYLRWNIIRNSATSLSNDFLKANFEYRQSSSGQKEDNPRWEKVMNRVNGNISDLVGQVYVKNHFSEEAKKRMILLVENLQQSFGERIDQLSWMSPETKKEAHLKLTSMRKKIGYPDKWETYEGLVLKADDYYGNNQRCSEWSFKDRLSKYGKAVDKSEWIRSPQTVNASYYSLNNEILFPAAILQFPFFDLKADDAVNYGAIGAVIGHEITHGFDDSGRKYDYKGNLRDWWTDSDASKFEIESQKVVEQFNRLTILDTVPVNGKLTLGENIADLGGLAIAWTAFTKTAEYKAGKLIDGMSPSQRFFYSWAQIWRSQILPEQAALQNKTDPHSPGNYRCNTNLSHFDPWYQAFDIQPGDALYIAPADRIKIW